MNALRIADDFELGYRARRALAYIDPAMDLERFARLSKEEVLSVPGIGIRTWHEIYQVLGPVRRNREREDRHQRNMADARSLVAKLGTILRGDPQIRVVHNPDQTIAIAETDLSDAGDLYSLRVAMR